jgi:small subunit ribosomal protein S8
MHTDPVADLLTRIRNGSRARLARVEIPTSKLKVEVCKILKQEGYIADYAVVPGKIQGTIDITLRYDERRQPVISNIQRVSKPGLRQYMRVGDIPKVRSGLGTLILSTSKGLMTDRDARKSNIGGEALAAIW